MDKDKELAKLVEKYVELMQNQSLSETDLAALIAKEENEKAQLLGIQVRYSTEINVTNPAPQGLSLCFRPIWGPGKVKWNFSNPGSTGAKYSVLPETGTSLIWASPPEQNVDGIYRDHSWPWGSCRAYKIPDSATATFYSADNWEVCYNAFACSALGHCPKWVNPCDNSSPEGSWPDHPLQ